jgi:hypothetical protein
LIGHFSIDSRIIMPANISIVALTFQVRVSGYQFETYQPALDLFDRDARRPRIRILNKRARAFVNLFSALGCNQYLEKPVIACDIMHHISLLSLLYRLMNSVFNSFSERSEAGNRSRLRVESLKHQVELRDRRRKL